MSISLSIVRSACRLPARVPPAFAHRPFVRFSGPDKAHCAGYCAVITVPAGRAAPPGPGAAAARRKCNSLCPGRYRIVERAEAKVSGLPGALGSCPGNGLPGGALRKGCVCQKPCTRSLRCNTVTESICWLAHARVEACNVGARSASRSTPDICRTCIHGR